MHTGHIISGAGHLALFAWALIGSFSLPPDDAIEVTDVALVSPEEFAALTPPVDQAPGADTDIAELPAPEAADTPPEAPSQADSAPAQTPPETAEAPAPEEAPEQPDLTTPQAEVSDSTDTITPPSEDVAAVVPETPDDAPRDIPRVAPRPVLREDRDIPVGESPQAPTAPADTAEDVQPAEDEKAPEEATTRILTEADETGDGLPKTSKRPPASRPVQTAAAEPEPKPAPTPEPTPKPEQKDAINDALNRALSGASEATPETPPAGPSGPPLTSGEKEALRVAVSACWNTGSLSTDALKTTVVVAVEMNDNGTPRGETIRMLTSSGGSGTAARQAFEAARRAIIRCGASGFGLPVDKYDHWREIEMTFNPEKMRIK
ncbi:energy transducer TonB [Pseudooceanicola sp.]|uniref:energy transducer TonB n=1 Tax=Pseudooceanicola sp. TaxID=1914328 RepID=UPI0035C72347